MLLSMALVVSAGALQAKAPTVVNDDITLSTDNKTDQDITVKVFYKPTDSTGNLIKKTEIFTVAAGSLDKKRALSFPKITTIEFENETDKFAKDETNNAIITSSDIANSTTKEFTVKLEIKGKKNDKKAVATLKTK